VNKKFTCIECPVGCALSVDIENCRVVKVEGNNCEKGEKYAITEVEHPMRVLTSTVRAEGLALKRVPVRTDKPVPKEKMMEAMGNIRKVVVKKTGHAGDVVAEGILGTDVNLVATRTFS